MASPNVPGGGYQRTGRDFSDLFRQWGSLPDNLRAMLNLAIPVVQVSTFRDDHEGSLWAITTGNAVSAVNEFPAAAFGTSENDWQVHQVVMRHTGFNFGSLAIAAAHIFTPDASYNPVATLNPVGFFAPGLITNFAFTFGTVRGVSGSNPVFAPIRGFETTSGWQTVVFGLDTVTAIDRVFDPPLRIQRDQTLAVQGTTRAATGMFWSVAILYNELPRGR